MLFHLLHLPTLNYASLCPITMSYQCLRDLKLQRLVHEDRLALKGEFHALRLQILIIALIFLPTLLISTFLSSPLLFQQVSDFLLHQTVLQNH